MIAPSAIVLAASGIALLVLAVAFLLTAWRVVAGPTLPDRILALDMLTGIAIGFIAVIAIRTGFSLYIDIAISLGLVGFLATVAFARFVLSRGLPQEEAVQAKRKPAKRGTKNKSKPAGKIGKAR